MIALCDRALPDDPVTGGKHTDRLMFFLPLHESAGRAIVNIIKGAINAHPVVKGNDDWALVAR